MNSEQMRGAWDRVAAGYEQFVAPLISPLAKQVLEQVGVGSGTRLLDVAAGTGTLAIEAAKLGAHVVASDISPKMIEHLQGSAGKAGVTIEGQVHDAHSLEGVESDSFDVVASQFGVNLLPNLNAGLSEMARVAKPGGKVVVIAFGPPQKAEFMGLFIGSIKAAVPEFQGPPMNPPPPQFQIADPAKFKQELESVSLTDVSVEPMTFGIKFGSAEQLMGFIMSSNPMGKKLLGQVTDEQKAQVVQNVAKALGERKNDQGHTVLSIGVNVGVGTK